jgi:hypothetical protein
MKRTSIFIIAAALAVLLAGCSPPSQTAGGTPSNAPESSFSAGDETPTPVETTPQATEPTQTAGEPTPSEAPGETAAASTPALTQKPEPSQKPDEPKPAASSAPKPTEKPAIPEPTPKPTDSPAAQEPTEPPQEKSIYDYEFDVEAIRKELIAIGKGMGLTHITTDGGAAKTPDNSSWGAPVTASQSFQGKNLERGLKDYVRSMPGIVTAYGGGEIEYFTIYVKPNGNGSYTFYFLY